MLNRENRIDVGVTITAHVAPDRSQPRDGGSLDRVRAHQPAGVNLPKPTELARLNTSNVSLD